MERRFAFKDHKADMFIEGYGKSFKEALENVAEGLFETISDTGKLKERKKIYVKESAHTLEELVTYLLNKIVSEGDSQELMFKRLKVLNFEEGKDIYSVEVEVFGQEMEHKFGRMYVKAVTHHEAKVESRESNWSIIILPDV